MAKTSRYLQITRVWSICARMIFSIKDRDVGLKLWRTSTTNFNVTLVRQTPWLMHLVGSLVEPYHVSIWKGIDARWCLSLN